MKANTINTRLGLLKFKPLFNLFLIVKTLNS